MSIFVNRLCPYCRGSDRETIGRMSVSTLLESNPGYVNSWFENGPVTPDLECTFVKCRDCEFIYVRDRLADKVNIEFYNQAIDSVHSRAKIFSVQKRRLLIAQWQKLHELANKDSVNVLDYGAGWGDFLAVAKSVGVQVCGLEFDSRKIEFALENGVPCGDFERVANCGPYDIFMCNQVLEHLDDPGEALQKLGDVLVPGAVGYVSVPNFPAKRLQDEFGSLRRGDLPRKDFDPLGHLNYFNETSFRKMLTKFCFEMIPVEYVGEKRGNFFKSMARKFNGKRECGMCQR